MYKHLTRTLGQSFPFEYHLKILTACTPTRRLGCQSRDPWLPKVMDWFVTSRIYFRRSPPRQERRTRSETSSAELSTIPAILVSFDNACKTWGIKRPKDGLGETSDSPRALKDGEVGEWILLDGVSPGHPSNHQHRKNPLATKQTPATCSNIALHNLYPGEIDLLVGSGLPTLPPTLPLKSHPSTHPTAHPVVRA